MTRFGPLVALVAAFLLGSLPFGLWVARIYRAGDLRSQGSGNIGATNVSRIAGFWPAGAWTLGLDVFKGALAVLLVHPATASLWTVPALGVTSDAIFSPTLVWTTGLAVVTGHCLTPWLRFKGGKGVATGLGAILVLAPWAALGGALAFALVFIRRQIGSLSSISGLLVASATELMIHPLGAHLIPGAVLVYLILLRHSSNLDALLENRELAF